MTHSRTEDEHSRTREGAPSRLLHRAYPLTAAALRLKNAPALRVVSVLVAMLLLTATLLSSDHVNRASFAWGTLLLVVNIFQLFLILWDLRPVSLHGEKKVLYDLIYSNLSVSSFNRLMSVAEWCDGSPGELLASQGSRVTEIIVLVSGGAELERDGKHVAILGAGAIIGEIGSLSALPFSSTIRLTEHSRYVVWKRDLLDHFFAIHPSIATGFERAFIARLDPTSSFRSAASSAS